jgi:alpha-tubulin suppressor-like RCC1 family protein
VTAVAVLGLPAAMARHGWVAVAAAAAPPESAPPAAPVPGLVKAWGDNTSGQVGDGTILFARLTPVTSLNLGDVVAVAAGNTHSLAVTAGGTVWAFGANENGQLGDGTTVTRATRVAVTGLTNIVAVAAGMSFSLALRGDGTVWAWGNNFWGQLGDGTTTTRLTPVPVTGVTHAVAVAAGYGYAMALLDDGTIRAWGWNVNGQLGDGTTTDRQVPTAVLDIDDARAIAAGGAHGVALRADGTLWTWGRNRSGQLGDGTVTDRPTRVVVPGLDQVVSVGAGNSHTLAVRNDGTVRSWGSNTNGELGDGTTVNRSTPVVVPGISGAAAVAGSIQTHSLALLRDGTVRSWGRNAYGQLGDGTTTNRLEPVTVSGLTRVTVVAAGGQHNLAVVAAAPVLDTPASPLRVGAANTLTGRYFSAGTVVKLFVATASGPVAYGPFTPSAWTATSLTVAVPATVPLGQGFGSLQVVNTDRFYAESNVVGALLEGEATLNLPTILFVNGVGLGPADPAIGVAHADTVVARGGPVTIVGTGFNAPAVNLFTATGNVGPLWPLAGGTATTIQVVVPGTAPVGPGSFQVVNNPYTGNVQSNAVAAVIGAPLTITSVSVAGGTVTVTGTGFSVLSVINLFNRQGGAAVNLGGLAGGTARVPLTLVSDTEFTFARPAGAVAGPAFVEVLNPPFIPFASSGTDPDGAFTFP